MRTTDIERLAARVQAATRDGGLIDTAQVKLVGLDEVRAAAGSRWPRMREHVREGSIKIIAGLIGPDDAVISAGDGFLVVFANSTADTNVRCQAIREALLGFYLGDEALRPLRADITRETASAANIANLVTDAAPPHLTEAQRTNLRLGRFWPVWSTQRQQIAAYLCGPSIGQAQPRLSYSVKYLQCGVNFEEDFLDLDLCLLEQACLAAGKPGAPPVGVTVHASTLRRTKTRSIYLKHLTATAGAANQCAFAMIAEIEPGVPIVSLASWISALKPAFGRVGLDLHHSDNALSSIATSGAWAAGFQLPTGFGKRHSDLNTLVHNTALKCQTLMRQRVLPMVHGFQEQSIFDLASCCDIALAMGHGVWPSVPELPLFQRQRQARERVYTC